MSCAAGPFVCVPSLLGPSERVEAHAQRKRLADRVVLSLPVRSRVDLFYLWSVSAGPRCTSSPGVHRLTFLPIYLSTDLPQARQLRH